MMVPEHCVPSEPVASGLYDRIDDGLIDHAIRTSGIADFIAVLGSLCADPPFEVERVFVSLQTIHPAFRARSYVWQSGTGAVSTREWPHGLKNRPGYYDSPDFHVHRTGSRLRVNLSQVEADHECDLYGELRAEGYADYVIIPLWFLDGTINTVSFATRVPGAFESAALDDFGRLAKLLTVILERYAALERVSTALATYLGRGTAQKVLEGRIRAGQGVMLDGAILFADLNDFTGYSRDLDPDRTVRLLNDYFDCLVGPVESHGGHVLKFVGDAIMAFFPEVSETGRADPCAAVRMARDCLRRLNLVRERDGDRPLRHGACLHYGPVLHGNVGSSERLDFTIIGQAVNVAQRGVGIAKRLTLDYVFTKAFVDRIGARGLVSIGSHRLKGISEQVDFYTFETGVGEQNQSQPFIETSRSTAGEHGHGRS